MLHTSSRSHLCSSWEDESQSTKGQATIVAPTASGTMWHPRTGAVTLHKPGERQDNHRSIDGACHP